MTSAHTHTLDHFVEPHVSEEHDNAQDEQLRTKRKNCPQMALFLAFNGDKNCKKPVYHNFHTIELNGESSNEENISDLNQPDTQHSISDIDNAENLDKNIGNYLMDKLFESGDIVPNNATKEQQRPSGAEEPKDENIMDHKYEELMSAMHLVLEKMGTSKETKEPGQLDQHTDDNEYDAETDVPETVTDEYGPIIDLSKTKSPISKNRNNYHPELDKPSNKPTKIDTPKKFPTKHETIQTTDGGEPDEEDLIYEEHPKDWEYPQIKDFNALFNKNRELGNIINDRMTHIQIQDLLKKCLGVSCECTKDRDFPAEGNDITLIPQMPYHPTQRYQRPRSDGNRKNNSSSHDSFSDGRPKRLKRPFRRTDSPSRNHWNSNYFDSSDKDQDREEYIQKKSIPFDTEIIPRQQKGFKRKETNSIPFAPVDEEWPEENIDDFLEKFSRIMNNKSKEERKTKLRSKSQVPKISRKEEDEMKMDLAQNLALIFLNAKRKIATNTGRTISNSPVPSKSNRRRSKAHDTANPPSISEQNENEFLKELVNALTEETPEDTYKGLPENEDDDDEDEETSQFSFNRNRSNMRHFVKPNIVHGARNVDSDDDESPDDDDTEMQTRENYSPSVRPNRAKIEEADGADGDESEVSDVESIANFNDAHSYVPKTHNSGSLRLSVARRNQKRPSSLNCPIETEEDDIEYSGDGMEKAVVDPRKLYHSQYLKPTVPKNKKIQTEKAVLKAPNSRGSKVYLPSPNPHSNRVEPNYRQQQNRPKPRPRQATEPLDDKKLKHELPAIIQKSRKSYEYNPKASETRSTRPQRPQRRIDELPEEVDESVDDEYGDEIIDDECLKHPSNTRTHRVPRPLTNTKKQRPSSGEMKSSKELHILINDPTNTEPLDDDAALDDTEEDEPLQDEALKYFRDHRNIRQQGKTNESKNASRPGNRRNGRIQSVRRETNAVTKSQRQHNDRRKAIVHREERGLFDRKRLQLLGSLSDSKTSRDSNNGKAISDRVITPNIDLSIETNELPLHSKKMFANGKKLSVVDPNYMDDQFLIYPELINEQMEFNPLEPSQDLNKKEIQKKVVAKVEKKVQESLEKQQKNQTVTSDTPTTTVNHPQARRYLNLFNNFKERVSLVTKKPAHAKYYRGYPPGVQKYAANYS